MKCNFYLSIHSLQIKKFFKEEHMVFETTDVFMALLEINWHNKISCYLMLRSSRFKNW